MGMRTHYDELHVTQDAPVKVIRAAYRVLSQQYHPDRAKTDDGGERMARINSAWDVLSDKERRASYDASINQVFERNVQAYEQQVTRKVRQRSMHAASSDGRQGLSPWVWLMVMVIALMVITRLFSRSAS